MLSASLGCDLLEASLLGGMFSASLVGGMFPASLLGGMHSASLLGGMLSASLLGDMISASLLGGMFSASGGVFSSFTMASMPSSVLMFCPSLLLFQAFLTTCNALTCLLRTVASLFKSVKLCHCWLHVFLALDVIDVIHKWTSQIEHQNMDVRF
jgi:hypothetical protein